MLGQKAYSLLQDQKSMESIMKYKGRARTPEEITAFIKAVNSKAPWELNRMHAKLCGELTRVERLFPRTADSL